MGEGHSNLPSTLDELRRGRNLIDELGEKTSIEYLTPDQRYVEKLATPDVNIADMIGDIDPSAPPAGVTTYPTS